MKILLTHRFFWPDTAPYALMLRMIGFELALAGHDVHIFTTLPSYREGVSAPRQERVGPLNVRRNRVFAREKSNPLRRLANVLIYCVALFIEVLRQRPDVVTASTFPPVVAAWSASLAARVTGAQFIYHMQDIHPEVSFYAGHRLGRGILGRLLRWMDNQSLRRAASVVTLSSDMVDTLRARGLPDLPIRVLNNPALQADAESAAPRGDLVKAAGVRRVIFAGNMGRFQNLPLLAEGVALCFDRHPNLELMFLGEGTVLPELKRRWRDCPQVRFAPFLPFAEARDVIANADIGLVALRPNIYRVAYPSKIATYLDLGLQVLALVEPQSQLAQDLERMGKGVVPAAPTAEAIAMALEQILLRPPVGCAPKRPQNRSQTHWPELVAALESRQ